MTNTDRLAATLRRLNTEARSLSSYQTAFVTQYDITRVTIDTDRLLSVLSTTDSSRLDDPNDLLELRERLNIVRADLASLLVSVQNLHEKAEEMDKTLNDAESILDNPDDVPVIHSHNHPTMYTAEQIAQATAARTPPRVRGHRRP